MELKKLPLIAALTFASGACNEGPSAEGSVGACGEEEQDGSHGEEGEGVDAAGVSSGSDGGDCPDDTPPTRVEDICAGVVHTCALLDNGEVR